MNKATPKHRSALDIVQAELGGLQGKAVDALDAASIRSLAERLNEFYDSWSPPINDDLRLYSGGWIAGNFQLEQARQYLFSTLVYYPQTVIHDPLADWFFPHRARLQPPPSVPGRNGLLIQGTEPGLLGGDGYYVFEEEPERTRSFLRGVLPTLALLKPAIDAGIIVPVPQWWIIRQRQAAILTAVRHDSQNPTFIDVIRSSADEPPPRGDHVRGMAVVPSGGWKSGYEGRGDSQDASYFLNKTLAIGDAVGALYVPPASVDARLLQLRYEATVAEARRADIELQMAPALMSAELPWLGNLDVKTLLAIRENSGAFEDWRAELRSVSRTISSSQADGEAFNAEAKSVIEDALVPRIHQLRDEMKRTAVLKSHAADGVVEIGLGAGSMIVVAAVTSAPIVIPALAGVAISAVAKWVLSPLLRGGPSGSSSVLATLIKKTR